MIEIPSPAKLNLSFRVLRKRPDGYHDIASLFQAIDLVDRLFFSWGHFDQITCTNPLIPTDSSNLVSKALSLFRSRFPFSRGVHIHIEKVIPIQAGLGGGSSNAATTLKALNQLTGNPATQQELIDLGAQIGSDVPFFFSSGTAFCTGRGEIMTPYQLPAPLSGWIAMPSFGLSTPLVYQNTTLSELPQSYSSPYFNDLEYAAFRLEPRLTAIKEALLKQFQIVTMTGSGTAFFCLDGAPQPIEGIAFSPFQSTLLLNGENNNDHC